MPIVDKIDILKYGLVLGYEGEYILPSDYVLEDSSTTICRKIGVFIVNHLIRYIFKSIEDIKDFWKCYTTILATIIAKYIRVIEYIFVRFRNFIVELV